MTSILIDGQKKGGGGGRVAVEDANTLRSKSYARVLDLISEGEIEGLVDGARSIYLNETPLENSDGTTNFDCSVEFRNGTQGQQYIPGFDAIENEVSVGTEILKNRPVTRSIANANINALDVKVRLNGLTSQNKKNGDISGSSATIQIQLESGNSGIFTTIVEDTIAGKTTSGYERSYRFPLIGEAPWRLRVNRLTEDSESSAVTNNTYFSSFTEIIDSKLSYPNSAIAGIIVDAQAFDSVPNRAYHVKLLRVKVPANYNPLTNTYDGAWDGTFKIAWTNNPAWCFYDVIDNDRYGLGGIIPRGTLDKWAVYSIGRYCDELVSDGRGGMEPRYRMNCYIQSRTQAYEVLRNMATAFAGMLYMSAGTITPVQDRPGEPEYLFTNSNVKDGVFSYQGSSASVRHTVALVTWNDLSDFGRQKVEYVEDFAGIRKFGVIETEVTAFGCTSQAQAHRFGRSILAAERMLTEVVNFSVGMEGFSLTPGMVIKVRDNLRYGKRLGGRVKEFGTSKDGKSVLTLDSDMELSPGEQYVFDLMTPGGIVKTKCKWINGTSRNQVVIEDALPSGENSAAVVGAAWIVTIDTDELQDKLYRITSASESNNEVHVSALEYHPAKYEYADDLNIVDGMDDLFGKPSEALSSKTPPAPQGVDVQVINASRDSSDYRGRIEVSWMKSDGVSRWEIELQPKGENTTRLTINGTPFASFGDLPEGEYAIRVRALNFKGSASQWVSSQTMHLGFEETTVAGLASDAEVVHPFTSISIGSGLLSIILNWKINPELAGQLHKFELWSKQGDPNALDFGEKFTLLATLPATATEYTHQDLAPGAQRIYLLRAIDRRGTKSEFYPMDRTLKAASSTDVTNVLNALEDSFRATNFFGEIINEIGKVSDLSELLAQSDLTELQELAGNINTDIFTLREDIRKVGWNLERDSELILRSVVLTEEARNQALGVVATMKTEIAKVESALEVGIGRMESIIAEKLGDTSESVSARIETEEHARLTADEALSVRISELVASYNAMTAQIVEERTARATADEASTKRLDSMQSAMDNADARALALLKSESETLTSAIGAAAKRIDNLGAQFEQEKSSARALITDEAKSRADADSSLSVRINSLSSSFETEKASTKSQIASETTARSNADSALSVRINSLSSSFETEKVSTKSQIASEATARSNADTALSTQITNLSAEVIGKDGKGGVKAALATEAKARADADTAQAATINALKLTVDGGKDSAGKTIKSISALIQEEQNARVAADNSQLTSINALKLTVDGGKDASGNTVKSISALLQEERNVRSTADTTQLNAINALKLTVDGGKDSAGKTVPSMVGRIDSEAVVRASADALLTTSLNDMSARLNTFSPSGKPTGSVEARIVTEEKARADADTALASRVTQLTSRLDSAGGSSAVTMEQSLTTTANAITGLNGKYSLKINNNGHVSGYGLLSTANNGATVSTFSVASDRFVIASPTSQTTIRTSTPFQVIATAQTINGQTVNPGVYISEAFIKNGVITSAKIGDLQVNTLKIRDQAVTQAIFRQTSGSLTSGGTGVLGDARIMTGAISVTGSGTATGSFKIAMTMNFLLEPVGDVAKYKSTNMTMRADIIRIAPSGGETVVRSGLVIGYSRAFSTALYAYGMGSVVLTHLDTLPNTQVGTYSYAIRVYGQGGNLIGFRVSNRTMILQEIKK